MRRLVSASRVLVSQALVLVVHIAAALVLSACGQSPLANPTVPSAPTTVPLGPGGTLPEATITPLRPGQTVIGIVNGSDQACDTHFLTDAPDPCQRFGITVPRSGILRVYVTSDGPNLLALWMGPSSGSQRVAYGVFDVNAGVSVRAGSSYDLAVALHAGYSSATSQRFELTTALDSIDEP